MPDLDQIKQEEQAMWDRRGRFPKGKSGNPFFKLSRPVKGAGHHAF